MTTRSGKRPFEHMAEEDYTRHESRGLRSALPEDLPSRSGGGDGNGAT